VTSEDDFQAVLDADPDDWHTRLVFADWLQERGDGRAEGYRALGRWRVKPIRIQMSKEEGQTEGEWQFIYGTDENRSDQARLRWGKCMLPAPWFKKLKQRNRHNGMPWWHYYDTRREAEDAAAEAFARLDRTHRAELVDPAPAPELPAPEPEPKPEPRKKRKRKGRSGEAS
jgi:uncharacterized protein (TIGR02996 family)